MMQNEDSKPLILCSNDDGFFARGLLASAEALSSIARVVVVAPETEQSAMSHSLTLHRPLRLRRVAEDRYALDGTPADCIYLALHLGENGTSKAILPRKPDLIVSGINKGINLGNDVFYSGTVAAAREGALRGIPSIAISTQVVVDSSSEPAGTVQFDPKPSAELVVKIAQSFLQSPQRRSLPTPLLNINVPAGPIRGIKATRLGERLWQESVEVRVDPRDRLYYWIGGASAQLGQIEGTDTATFNQGLVSMTLLGLDLTRADSNATALVQDILQNVSSH